MYSIYRIRNPYALVLPELNAFLRDAVSTGTFVEDPGAALTELARICPDPDVGLFVGPMARRGSRPY